MSFGGHLAFYFFLQKQRLIRFSKKGEITESDIMENRITCLISSKQKDTYKEGSLFVLFAIKFINLIYLSDLPAKGSCLV